MKSAIHKWALNVIPVPNPTQYTKKCKNIVKTQKSKLVQNTTKKNVKIKYFYVDMTGNGLHACIIYLARLTCGAGAARTIRAWGRLQKKTYSTRKNTYYTSKFDIIDLNKYQLDTYFDMAFYVFNISYNISNI